MYRLSTEKVCLNANRDLPQQKYVALLTILFYYDTVSFHESHSPKTEMY